MPRQELVRLIGNRLDGNNICAAVLGYERWKRSAPEVNWETRVVGKDPRGKAEKFLEKLSSVFQGHKRAQRLLIRPINPILSIEICLSGID
jgi:hypothetical protein